MFAMGSTRFLSENLEKTTHNLMKRNPPKAAVTGSNSVGWANNFNVLVVLQFQSVTSSKRIASGEVQLRRVYLARYSRISPGWPS